MSGKEIPAQWDIEHKPDFTVLQAEKGWPKQAMYESTKGAEPRLTGASIRLAESMAQNWGTWTSELLNWSRKTAKAIKVIAYAWDLETNARQIKTYRAACTQYEKKGILPLRDEGYLWDGGQSRVPRRLRACILRNIEGDVSDQASEQCNETLAGQSAKGIWLIRWRQIARTFQDAYGVARCWKREYT